MQNIRAIKQEILTIQNEDLLPRNFKILSDLHQKGSQVKEKLQSACIHLTAETIDFLPELNILFRLTLRLRTNTIAFWNETLKITVDAIPTDTIARLPLTCSRAIKYAISEKRLPKNFVKKSREKRLIKQLLESQNRLTLDDRNPLFFSANLCWLPRCGREEGVAVVRGEVENLKFWQKYIHNNYCINAKLCVQKRKSYLPEKEAINQAFGSVGGNYLLLECFFPTQHTMDLLKSLDLASPEIPPESYLPQNII